MLVDGQPAATITPVGAGPTTLAGTFSHDVAAFEQFSYRVCFKPLNQDQVCSANRNGPKPMVIGKVDPDVVAPDDNAIIVAGDVDPDMATTSGLPPLKKRGDISSDMTTDPVATVDFNGIWVGSSDKGWNYRWVLQQNGARVFGDYVCTDNGAGGTMKGTVNGNVLSFQWVDNAGFYRGSGKLTLGGNAFSGSYRVTYIGDGASLTQDLMQGLWNGSRQ